MIEYCAKCTSAYPEDCARTCPYKLTRYTMGACTALNRAVGNSPPPLDDVGGVDPQAFDECDPNRPIAALLTARGNTHGSFALNALHGQKLRELFRSSPGWGKAAPREREALDYIAGKLSRILSGHPGHADHWADIAGYATLVCHPNTQR